MSGRVHLRLAAQDGRRSGLRVAAITRLATQNAGNAALSHCLIDLLSRHPAVEDLRTIDRYPRRLEAWRLGATPERRFAAGEAWLERAAIRGPAAGAAAAAETAQPIRPRLDVTGRELPGFVRALKRRIGLRRNLARFGLIEAAEFHRVLADIAWADLVVWNPAGEIHPGGDSDAVFRLLLMVRLAQRLGKHTAIVNHSLELEDARLWTPLSRVYGAADLVLVRDAGSWEVAQSLGVPPDRLEEAPDLVFSWPPSVPPRPLAPDAPIGLALNGVIAAPDDPEWERLVQGLAGLGRKLVFVSNAMNHDAPLAARLARHAPIQVVHGQPGPHALADLFGSMAAVVSSRLHAAILAIAAGAPVVTLEPQVFKLTGVLQQMDYPFSALSLARPGWSEAAVARVRRALDQRAEISRLGLEGLARQAARIERAYGRLSSLQG